MTAQLLDQSSLIARDPEPDDAEEPFPDIDDEDAEEQS